MPLSDIQKKARADRFMEETDAIPLSVRQIADRCKMDDSYLSMLRTGERGITEKKKKQIERAFPGRIDWVYVFEGVRSEKTTPETIAKMIVEEPPSDYGGGGVMEKMESRVVRIELEVKRLAEQGDRLESLLGEIRDLLRH